MVFAPRRLTLRGMTHTPRSHPRPSAARALLAALLLATATFTTPAAHAAPDEAAYGADQGYPVGTRSNWAARDRMVGSFSAMDQIFPVRRVPMGSTVRELPRADKAPDWPFVDAYLASHPATGLLVMKDGRILVERYQYGRKAEDRFTSFSMAKTVVGLAVGIAVSEGRIASIDDPVDRYEPALAQTAWKGVPIRHVLNMASGVRFDETYDRRDTDIARLSRPWTMQEGGLLDALQTLQARENPPGDKFRYISADTQVLAQVLAAATGQPLANYVGARLWGPMGAEADGQWVLDTKGTEAAYCCLSARLRDWGRLGQLMLEGGERAGQRIVPREWIEAGTSVRFRDGHLQPYRATPYFGYGYQTWVFPDNLGFALLGVRGQSVFVHPRLRLVMVQTAVWPRSIDLELSRQRDQFWRELVLAAGRL